MASTAKARRWLRGKVKAVPSGDTLVIMGMGSTKAEIPPEKTITLSSLMAPKLARRGGVDEPFAWQSREFLRKLCIGKVVTFLVDYSVPSIGREFGTVFLEDKNVASLVVAQGWAKVREVREQQKERGEYSPYLNELLRLEGQAKKQGVGRWSKATGASEAAIRNLPPSAVVDPSNLDAMGLLAENKGRPMEAIVEHVRDGSTLRVYLLPEYQFVQVFVAGIQAPPMGKRIPQSETTSVEANGKNSSEPHVPLTSAQTVAATAASLNGIIDPPFARESKHFTEIHVLHRDVRIVLEGVDKFSNLIGSVYYPEGEVTKNLAQQLVENGLARYVDWSANMLDDDVKRLLKSAELESKKSRLRMWTNYVPPHTDSKAIQDQNFTGTVVEVVSGDCITVADVSLPFDSPLAERRVNLSSIRRPRLINSGSEDKGKVAPYAREAREYLRKLLIGRQVHVSMEYSRKVNFVEGRGAPTGPEAANRVMDFGSVFLVSPSRNAEDASQAPSIAGNKHPMTNIAEMVVARGFAEVVRHRDLEVRSNHYDALLAAESRAKSGKKGLHSGKDAPVTHVKDLLMASPKKTRDFLPFLQRNRRMTAVVEHVFNGHRYKLYVPKETCSIAFSLSGVRCPGRDEPHSGEAIALLRRKILQRDVEIEVETVDRTGTFLGSLWVSNSNVALTLLGSGLAKLQTSFNADMIPDFHLLAQAEQSAKKQKLKIWEKYVEGEEVSNGQAAERKQKEELQVLVTEVLGGGKFYVQLAADKKVASIQQQLSSLKLQEAPGIGSFNPKKGDIVLAQFSGDDSWNRAMIVTAPQGVVESPEVKFEVFYIDYGNQEVVTYSRLQPLDSSISSSPGLAQLCSLAYVKVPSLGEDYGEEAAIRLSELILYSQKEFKAIIEERDTSGGKVKGQGTGTILMVTLVDTEAEISINAVMLKEGLARLAKRRRREPAGKKQIIDELEEYQDEARIQRLCMWENGNIMSDDDDNSLPVKKAGGKQR